MRPDDIFHLRFKQTIIYIIIYHFVCVFPYVSSAIDCVSRRNACRQLVLEVLSVFLKEVDSFNFVH